MTEETKNIKLIKPDETEFYDVNVTNKNWDIVDEQVGALKNPEYETPEEPAELVSGENLGTALGKLAAAVKLLLTHKVQQATATILGHVKLSDSAAITEKGVYALDAVEKNASVSGTMANKIDALNSSLENYITVRHGHFGTSGTSTLWAQHPAYSQEYQYPYSFPNVDGYKFLIGFTCISWTNGNNYYNYMLRNNILNNQSDKVEVYSGQGTPDCRMYFFGLYVKS